MSKKKAKKQPFRFAPLLKTIAVFLVLEAGIVLLGVFECNYKRVEATADNTVTVAVRPSRIEQNNRPNAADTVELYEGTDIYQLVWRGAFSRIIQMNSRELEKALLNESLLTVTAEKETKQDGTWTVHDVVGLRGETKEYLTVEQYNAWHESNAKVGIAILSVFQIILLAIFVPLWWLFARW